MFLMQEERRGGGSKCLKLAQARCLIVIKWSKCFINFLTATLYCYFSPIKNENISNVTMIISSIYTSQTYLLYPWNDKMNLTTLSNHLIVLQQCFSTFWYLGTPQIKYCAKTRLFFKQFLIYCLALGYLQHEYLRLITAALPQQSVLCFSTFWYSGTPKSKNVPKLDYFFTQFLIYCVTPATCSHTLRGTSTPG